jgi:hypothetical protein
MPIEYMGHDLELGHHRLDVLNAMAYRFELGTVEKAFWVIQMVMPRWVVQVVWVVFEPAMHILVPFYRLDPQLAHLQLSRDQGHLIFVSQYLLEYPVKLLECLFLFPARYHIYLIILTKIEL